MKRSQPKIASLFILVLIIVFQQTQLFAQSSETKKWNDKNCTVVLTYDDGLNVHLDNVIPTLDKAGFKGTFYVPGKCQTMNERINEWRQVANNGHELGNHTLFHPCNGTLPNRNWVSEDYDLSTYSTQRIRDEITVANTLLKAIDGKTERTYAYTCGDFTVENESFVEYLKPEFVAARNVQRGYNLMESIDLFQLKCFGINNKTGKELIEIVKEGEKQGALIVFLFHGVGGEHSLNVSTEAHLELINYLKKNENDIWTTTLEKVSTFIKNSSTN